MLTTQTPSLPWVSSSVFCATWYLQQTRTYPLLPWVFTIFYATWGTSAVPPPTHTHTLVPTLFFLGFYLLFYSIWVSISTDSDSVQIFLNLLATTKQNSFDLYTHQKLDKILKLIIYTINDWRYRQRFCTKAILGREQCGLIILFWIMQSIL